MRSNISYQHSSWSSLVWALVHLLFSTKLLSITIITFHVWNPKAYWWKYMWFYFSEIFIQIQNKNIQESASESVIYTKYQPISPGLNVLRYCTFQSSLPFPTMWLRSIYSVKLAHRLYFNWRLSSHNISCQPKGREPKNTGFSSYGSTVICKIGASSAVSKVTSVAERTPAKLLPCCHDNHRDPWTLMECIFWHI